MIRKGGPDATDGALDDVQQQILAAKQQMHPGKNIHALENQCRGRCRNAFNAPRHNA